MNAIWLTTQEQRRLRRRKRRLQLSVLLFFLALPGLLLTALPRSSSSALPGPGFDASSPVLSPTPIVEAPAPPPVPDHIRSRDIAPGDTLSSIFDLVGIGQSTMYQILAADEQLLALDTLRPGNRLTFTLDEQTGELANMELYIHPGKRVMYHRVDGATFDYEEIVLPGEWMPEFLDGTISGSFYLSAKNVGLSENETVNIADLFRDQLNFARDIRAGDTFQVVRSQQFVNGEWTGQSRIEGVRLFRGKRLYSAFLFEDGNYYDHKGESLARAFRRYPTQGQYRVSSAFSRTRRHPVTGRVSPHNGVDFAMPTGTPVLATGDGVVTRVQNHPFAGKYVEIQHGSHYTTRYLHLSRSLVRRGQTVQRGQRIALSGNTGRSTGPHLHFELHTKGRPVNPLTASIPMASAVPKGKLAQFNERVNEVVALMAVPSQRIAQPAVASDSPRQLAEQAHQTATVAAPSS
ncbi:peptidoglycan DD-metalloendopeptidase family protein [Desulfuromonas sp. KJ2020]|uniref:peptidoglycan DD-metalloendopeptidase family protein n=1 Tax=Desulfuromonas sp. KJ2020 TaxID=2919173 RepID=UPI0020A6E658|nr:peptidoglycan DD-metalloendopeptidase family protein [Desulfuromonas sp. KJ2020]MCP3177103.1 peptidoglycan DD-metalloendopeptidase family protein [Desulfuromonas sp. KJ2020]